MSLFLLAYWIQFTSRPRTSNDFTIIIRNFVIYHITWIDMKKGKTRQDLKLENEYNS